MEPIEGGEEDCYAQVEGEEELKGIGAGRPRIGLPLPSRNEEISDEDTNNEGDDSKGSLHVSILRGLERTRSSHPVTRWIAKLTH